MAKKKISKKRVLKRPVTKFPWFRKCKKDNNAKWGFIPINWKGWVALILLIAINVFAANYFDVLNSSFREVSKFLVVFLLSITVFALVAQRKTKV